jgi:hypothetical protein
MKFNFSCLFILFFPVILFSQTDTAKVSDKWKLDSNYVISYPEKLVLGIFESFRMYDLMFTQKMVSDTGGVSSMNYIARGNSSHGIDFAYDKIAFSLGTSIEATETDIFRKGITKTRNVGFSINSKKYRLEGAYRKYTGFYENNTGKRDTNFNDSTPYFQMPNMYSRAFRLKGFYFFNKKRRYSYGAAFNNTARQLKTAGTFLFVSNLYKFSLRSDSTWIQANNAFYYPGWEKLNSFITHGLSFNFGYTFNLVVFKRFFAHATGTLGLELQKYNYGSENGSLQKDGWLFGFGSADLRGSIGYNGEKIYAIFSYVGDFNGYDLKELRFDTRLNYFSFNFGYRFKVKENKLTHWLKNNRLYKMI